MATDKRLRPTSYSESSDTESPADKQLRLESGSDEAALIPLPDSSDEDWVIVRKKRDRNHRSNPPPPPSPPRSRSTLGTANSPTSATPTLTNGSRPTPFPRTTAAASPASTAATSPASTAAPSPASAATTPPASAAAHTTLLGAVSHPEQAATRQAATAPARPKVVVPPTPGFDTALDLTDALEEQLGLRFQMRFLESGSVLVTPPSEEALRALLDTTSVRGKAVQLRLMGDATTKGVVTSYPLAMPLKALLRHPSVVTAERCQTRDNLATRQVLISVRGPMPGMLDLGSWGVFYTRLFNTEPLRCYRCQQYGHHRSRCNRQAVCGMCSGPHMTEACQAKYKAGENVPALCPNCRQHHHAWSRRCPSRLNIVDRGIQRQEEWRAAHNPSRPAWTGRSRSRSQRQPAPPGPTTLASQEHFSALPPPGASRGNAAPAVPLPATPPHPASTSTPATPPRPASASGPSAQQEQRTPALPPPALPQRVSAPAAPLVPPPGHVLVTRAALEGVLASFTLALTGLLQLTPDEAALRVIAKATVEECFPTVASPAASPATPLQTPVAAPPTAQTLASEDAPPPVGEARMEVDAPSRSSQPAVVPAVAVARPAPATQTAKPRSHIPVRMAPARSRIP
ncbi:uncharacterized protein LOC126986899 [Eriocheir sinensis]|uniref:uncharacterized protein LOC126986899 n=1 Tax=Eriocheir sinensis TaxID=95602 RepID=UPI0021C9E994|nr:uncharacterized protein LOC126986899 [Eriocheir sinensis]